MRSSLEIFGGNLLASWISYRTIPPSTQNGVSPNAEVEDPPIIITDAPASATL